MLKRHQDINFYSNYKIQGDCILKINRPTVCSHKPIKGKLLINYKECSKKVTATFGGIPTHTYRHFINPLLTVIVYTLI